MNPNVPSGAAILLDFIGGIEAPEGYGTIYANKQSKLPKPLTEMTLDEVQAAQVGWSKHHGSSAAGRYQFMRATLKGLMADLGLRGSQKFSADLQDALGYELLKRRGFIAFRSGAKTPRAFGNDLAKEWASLPVLTDTKGAKRAVRRGETYYAADGINKVLTTPEKVEAALTAAFNANIPAQPTSTPPAPPKPEPQKPDNGKKVGIGLIVGAVVTGLIMVGGAAWDFITALWNMVF